MRTEASSAKVVTHNSIPAMKEEEEERKKLLLLIVSMIPIVTHSLFSHPALHSTTNGPESNLEGGGAVAAATKYPVHNLII